MGRWASAVLLGLVLAGCTRVVDSAQPQPERAVAPIAAGQVGDLLSDDAQKGDDGNLFVTVEPEECSGLAREVDAPFVFDSNPAAHDGGHWETDAGTYVYVEEIVAVYRADFDPKAAVDRVKRTFDSCRDTPLTITTLDGDVDVYRLLPLADSEPPELVSWSFKSGGWACDNAFVAAHNAAIELTTCAEVNGYDVLSLAQDALKRIEALANTTA